ncbi:hypothetical protein A2U94_13755 [Bacillus sp. VT 712]|uniref:DUF4145 domain-containing protein n=1 Tax=Bacillaceae TaxID=186817 RepID=UPI0004733538|nr:MULTISPECIES: DUF4145 domain-containing protein [Bacillaceae]KZB90908.1 hypothetical protein A2U94_13755 [Bacillus sp. VT 712]
MEQLEERVYCFSCNQKTKHDIVHTYEEFADDPEDMWWNAKFHITKCAGCERVTFVEEYIDEYTWDYVNGEKVWKAIFKSFPEEPPEESAVEKFEKRLNLEKKEFPHMPNILLELYKQIIDSYNMRHNILCASGIRTLIEGICNELGVKKGYIYEVDGTKKIENDKEIYTDNLAGRIFGLFEKGYIIFPQALILNKIKSIGNKAVHSVISPDTIELREIIQVMEQTLNVIYELKDHKLLNNKKEENKK